jgi:hypothetical protein|tara:strand:+ start:102 stop:347 length:246 start_codon:yes stop_codon:yes gene_type:complete
MKGFSMEVIANVKAWASGLADLGVSIAALAIIVEVLGMGAIPFMGDMSVISNVSSIMASIGSEGLMGLVAVWVLYSIWNRR